MKIFSYFIYRFLSKIYLKRNNFHRCLKFFRKSIAKNLLPNPKTINYDIECLDIAEKIFKFNNLDFQKKEINFSKKILILNSEISDIGGHTELVLRLLKHFKDKYYCDFLITNLGKCSKDIAPIKSKIIKQYVSKYIEFDAKYPNDKKVIDIYNYVLNNNISTIYVNMHMYDAVGCAVLGLLKKYTNINILFSNHGDHFYSLGTTFATNIITRCKNGKSITPYLYEYKNVCNPPFIIDMKALDFVNDKKIIELKNDLGIPQTAFITTTGCPRYKICDEYFKLINKILTKNTNIFHILFINRKHHNEILNKIGHLPNLILLDFVSNFSDYIQMSDLYIDSFPQGSALTLIDFIKYRKPVIIRKNIESPISSFEEYLYEDYEYICLSSDEMYQKTIKILSDREEYERIAHKVYKHCKNVYDVDNSLPALEVFIK